MKPQFQHSITSSFALWFDNYLLRKGEAFKNYSTSLTHLDDDRLATGLEGFSSPYKQWVFDNGISGAEVPSSVSVDGVDTPRSSTLAIDYQNGRVVSSTISVGAAVTASYAVKDFNTYVTSETEENLIIESQFDTNSRFNQASTPIPPYDQVLPAIFINNVKNKNDPFSFGGEEQTTSDIRCVVLAENIYQLDGVLSIFNDSNKEVFAALSFEDYPITEQGDAPNYNYKTLSDTKLAASPGALHHIDRVDVSKLSDRITKQVSPNTFVGFIDFEVLTYRYPRI